ncbi:MAG: PHP domain-containing protein [Balneolaceae bacterium]
MGRADLHLHTTASDGSCEPEEIPDLVRSHHLETLSITDHDTLSGYDRVAHLLGSDSDLTLIPGVEFTATVPGRQIHVLAYDFDPDSNRIRSLIRRQIDARSNRMEEILGLLSKQGIEVTLEEVQAQARSRVVGRPHLAQALVRKRVVATVGEAFMRHLSGQVIDSIKTDFVELEELTNCVAEAGGVTSLAHPGPLYDQNEVIEYMEVGLDGIEVIHPSHDFEQQKRFRELARERRVLETGGSDFHGSSNTYAPWLGVVTIGSGHVASLRRLARQRKSWKKEKGGSHETS